MDVSNIKMYSIRKFLIRFDLNCSKASMCAQMAVIVVNTSMLYPGFFGNQDDIFETEPNLTIHSFKYANQFS